MAELGEATDDKPQRLSSGSAHDTPVHQRCDKSQSCSWPAIGTPLTASKKLEVSTQVQSLFHFLLQTSFIYSTFPPVQVLGKHMSRPRSTNVQVVAGSIHGGPSPHQPARKPICTNCSTLPLQITQLQPKIVIASDVARSWISSSLRRELVLSKTAVRWEMCPSRSANAGLWWCWRSESQPEEWMCVLWSMTMARVDSSAVCFEHK